MYTIREHSKFYGIEVFETASMAHAIDVAVSFRFVDNPWICTSVRPNGICLTRIDRFSGAQEYMYIVTRDSLASDWIQH